MMLEYKHFIISERVVSRCYYFFTGLKSFEYLIVLWVLSSDAYLASRCLAAIWRDDVNPFSAGLLVECASWDKHCVLSLSELEVQIVSLRMLSGASPSNLKSALNLPSRTSGYTLRMIALYDSFCLWKVAQSPAFTLSI